MKKLIWLTFDLGIRGDYEGFYAFLDDRNAKECGDNSAAFLMEYEGDPITALREQLKSSFTIDKRSRIYAVIPGIDGKAKGMFIFGKRKAGMWKGYGVAVTDEEDVGE